MQEKESIVLVRQANFDTLFFILYTLYFQENKNRIGTSLYDLCQFMHRR